MFRTDTVADRMVVTAAPRRSGIATYFANVLAGIRDGSEMQARYEELSRLSDVDLARRGLTRADVMRAILICDSM
jgi:hypothetical protein